MTQSEPLERVCVVAPYKEAYSETFIQVHVSQLPGTVRALYLEIPSRLELDDSTKLLSKPERARAMLHRVRGNEAGAARIEAKRFAKFLRRERIQVVLAEYGPTGVAVMTACEKAGIPLVVHFHGFDAHEHAVLTDHHESYQLLFEKAAAIVVVSRRMRDSLVGLGADAGRLHLSPYGVDTDFFTSSRPDLAPPLFVAIGRFVDKKAPHITLLAFERVLKEQPTARLIMMGDGPLQESSRAIIRALGLDSQVGLLPPAPSSAVAELLRSARAFVQHSVTPSHGDSEGMPVVMMEAMSSGLPVVSTRHAGIPELVDHGRSGFLVEEYAVEEMASFMARLSADGGLAREMGERGRTIVLEHFTREASLGRLWQILSNSSR